MHRRLLVVSSALMCALAVFVAWVLCDLHDRSLPQELHPFAVVTVTLPDGMDDADALRQLAEQNKKLGLGLVRIVPDMEHGTDAQVFVPLPGTTLQSVKPGMLIRRFGSLPDGKVAGSDRLNSASAGGQYLVCGRWGDPARTGLGTWAAGAGVRLEYGDDDLAGDLRMLLGQSSFRAALGATVALIAVLVLFWLSFKARSRALRVLAGVPAWKIQYDDAVGLMLPMLMVAVIVDAATALGVLVSRGGVFVPYLLRVMLLLEATAFACLLAFTLVLSAVCWPSVRMIADRQPMPRGLLRASVLVKAVVFVAVLAVLAPSMLSFREASDATREQSVWQRLRDQVSVSVTFGPDRTDMDAKAAVLIHAMERQGKAALSYTFTDGQENQTTTDTPVAGLVTRSWLDLIGIDLDLDATDGITPVNVDRLDDPARQIIDQFVTWAKDDAQARRLRNESKYYVADGVTVPLLKGGSDEMLFSRHAAIIVVPDLNGFSDSGFLTPALSSRNIVLTGLDDTRRQAAQAGLGAAISVRYIAETQILRAQFSAYFAWMQAAAIILLLAALAMVALVGADVRATLRAGHDYPLLLAGYAPGRLATPTILAETLFALATAGVVSIILVTQQSDGVSITLLVAALAALFSAVCHRTATASRFHAINDRTL
ncbi:hypothetical protein DSM100688_0478 [Bifidobacterium ramosum]|uniref:DUF1430 domain-containing protein n=1 Tax=Bifidobacterium ramosum TaxID=1798158 RepID=A0A6L4X3R9_9BIFI|nr:hypothetical protein [Bifidobacterium ramosum]KAB8289398.1 hypothetical protein DSM100688_0478 [Bifidobacterium ramosum]NEG71097.1 hypothetical protein [Bifidobacterium ramosum]